MIGRACDVCENADDMSACPCTDIAIVSQTTMLDYTDGSTGPYTDIATLCLQCRQTFAAWGDVIREYVP